MRNVEIYVNSNDTWTRLDLFDDETIQLTDSIQDVKDIKKVFTAFSQTFKVPASDNNNKLFKHYYNADIDGYDGRFRKDALIKIDGVDFKLGRIRLNSVDLSKNLPTAYNVTFFGSTVQLTELLGEDELGDLEGTTVLNAYNFAYTASYVETGLETGYNSGDFIFPFISAKNYYYYDTNNGDYTIELPDGATSRNVKSSNTSTNKGIYYTDLKPAIKVSKVIDAIEEKYGITFSSDFFSNDVFTELYLWLHREKGQITEQLGSQIQAFKITDFEEDGLPSLGDRPIGPNQDLDTLVTIANDVAWDIVITVTPDNGTDTYDLSIPESNTSEFTGLVGTQTRTFECRVDGSYTPNITIKSSGGNLGNYSVDMQVKELYWDNTFSDWLPQEDYEFLPISVVLSETTTASQMPKIKTIDFLTSLFKMFNLTAYFNGSELVVKTLNNYYASGTSYDITNYIDTNTSNISKSNIYRNVAFRFTDSKTFAAYNSNLITADEFGNEDFEDRDMDGGIYSLDVKFEKMMYERMSNQFNESTTDVQWGWFVDDNKNEYISSPLLFYAENVSANLSFDKGGSITTINSYFKPSNIKTDLSQSLHFGSELNEYTGDVNDESLFKTYYSTYIDNVFDKKARIYTFTAYLPSQILNRYELNDTFIIGNREYRINKIKVNLLNGKSELELINKL